ncbi:MAG TPA: phytoene desaturase family protein [Calditrichia bacterium]|nr:phytoene desaturase [Calditrichota bacterium]HQU74222.1 phytoene desaturase family protein [Calditrichia bacterium]HQV30282.1 phytoene desaturase family protein [Calditrichia bacterium]
MKKNSEQQQVVVIGSGFGGLSAAIRLQARGFQVTLIEKNEKVGGHAYQLVKNGYTFDMGPSLITAPDIIEDVFQAAGKTTADYLDLIYLDPFYRIYFHDGSMLDYTGDADEMKTQMAAFNPQDARNYDRFISYIKKIYEAVIVDKLGATPFDLGTMMRFLPKALQLKALLPAFHVVKKFFKDPRNQFAFSFHPLFIGGSPFRAPSVYLMIPYLEKEGGVWFTKGGMYSLVEAFQKVFLEIGGTIRTATEASQIVVENKRVRGVETQHGDFIPADLVVSNAHFTHTYKDLIDPNQRSRWTDKKVTQLKYGMSCFLMYMGVKKQYPQLLHHTLILSERYKGLVKDIFDNKILPEDFSMYLHVPTRTDAGMAPEGCESMYVLIPVPNLAADINWQEKKQAYADKILNFLEEDFGLQDLRQNLEVLELFTPEDFRDQRNNFLGTAWGVEPMLTQTASFRPHNKSEDIEGLYLVGASTHPGAGVPGVLLTAEATENAILSDLGIPKEQKRLQPLIA